MIIAVIPLVPFGSHFIGVDDIVGDGRTFRQSVVSTTRTWSPIENFGRFPPMHAPVLLHVWFVPHNESFKMYNVPRLLHCLHCVPVSIVPWLHPNGGGLLMHCP